MITNTILGSPYCISSIIYPKTLFQLLRPPHYGRRLMLIDMDSNLQQRLQLRYKHEIM